MSAPIWNRDSALAHIAKCTFSCEGGPLENNVAFAWLKAALEDGPKYLPGQQVWFEVVAEAQSIKLSQWVCLWVCGVSMGSTSERRTWEYALTNDRPDAYHYGATLFTRVAEGALRDEKPGGAA